MPSFATTNADTLDQYIAKLQALRAKHGGSCPVLTAASEYPEGANCPHYVTKQQANGYTPEGTIVLD